MFVLISGQGVLIMEEKYRRKKMDNQNSNQNNNNPNNKNPKNNRNNKQGISFIILVTLITTVMVMALFQFQGTGSDNEISYDEFLEMVEIGRASCRERV